MSTTTVPQWGVFEASFAAQVPGNPFTTVDLTAEFRQGQDTLVVDGFYDGDGIYRIRFSPSHREPVSFVTRSNIAELNNQTGKFTVGPPEAHNHGPLSVDAKDPFHFRHADGAFHSCVGTTSYVWALQPESRAQETLRTCKSSGFNKMRMCLFPKHYRWNIQEPERYPFAALKIPRSAKAKEDPANWKWDFSTLDPQYFQTLEKRIGALGKLGIEADIILFHPYDRWGFSMMSPDQDRRYLRYVMARLGAFSHVWWSLANEWDLFKTKSAEDFDRLGRFVQAIDPYNRLRSIHNCWKNYDHTRSWITHASLQHFEDPLYQDIVGWRQAYGKPVVIDENRYEGNVPTDWGSLPAETLVHRFWMATVAGGYNGHSETVMHKSEQFWWSHGGQLRGESPKRLAFMRKVVESGPAQGLTPSSRKVSPWAGHKGKDWHLFYFGPNQPSGWAFELPEGRFRLELIDTWNCKITVLAPNAKAGQIINLPSRPYLAVRATRKNATS
jgi:hypothetical protein